MRTPPFREAYLESVRSDNLSRDIRAQGGVARMSDPAHSSRRSKRRHNPGDGKSADRTLGGMSDPASVGGGLR